MKVQNSILRSMFLATAALAAVASHAQAQPVPASYIECSGTNVALPATSEAAQAARCRSMLVVPSTAAMTPGRLKRPRFWGTC